ncbi:hypothetical protein IVA93_38110 (plasmid) [Bradyrhizobium sp. 155]|uniref:hypothetical protein n=1 Tax=Bradyrhizobium sp. 155 TaxID=2782629 RepID=UPI001FFEFE0D|nr:hypothetical protein [Bradyrhizobium sp. 155]UPK15574.1 hypothetical protein IVA93_38110 [Bradyrhizobium sp. 155]
MPPMVFSSRDDWTTSRRSLQQRGARTPATLNGWACAAAARRERKRTYGATIKDAMTALWEAWDWACGKRLKAMIPTLLPASNMAEQLGQADRDRVLAINAATVIACSSR